jgi:CMP-N-acetylneuraminic acid synthetase/spore coat polysaccharide biosynthesis predicted glycosyltransferase SpsG
MPTSGMSTERSMSQRAPRPESSERPLLAIIPARGGSKGVPNKNLRLLGDRPLLAYSLDCVTEAGIADRLVVSSESEEILRWVELRGHETLRRPAHLATDEATVSDVAAYVADELDWTGDVGVFQPTSPFRRPETVVAGLERFRESGADSLGSCVREHRGFWYDEHDDLGRARPLFKERVNRQWARHPVFRETGALQFVTAEALRKGRQVAAERHLLFETAREEALDIDTNEDLVIARRRLDQGTVIFRLRANTEIGSGHIYHCLQLADELADQRLHFLLRDCDPFVYRLIEENGYTHRTETDLAEDLSALRGPEGNVVVNDVLDTTEREILIQRSGGFRVVNVEDLGPGAKLADWVVNALYPVSNGAAGHVVTGPEYTTLRSEFFHLPRREPRRDPERILITFGGTDPGSLAARCARLLVDRVDAEVRVVLGAGAQTERFPEKAVVLPHVRSMAAEMLASDLVITAAGRTVYEAAAVGTPVAVLAQGAREATHSHLSYSSGVVFLGIGPLVDDQHVVGVVERLLADYSLRVELSERLRKSVDPLGAARIGHKIRAMLKGLS